MIIYNRFTEKNKVPQPLQFSELTLKIKRHDIAHLTVEQNYMKIEVFPNV